MLSKRTLGKTKIEVSPIGIGVMMWAGGKGIIWGRMPAIPEQTKTSLIKEAYAGGVNFFDTAEMYGSGHSESTLASALTVNGIEDKNVVIGTKWRPLLRRARNIRKSINDRIKYLDPYTIDLYMIHLPYSFSSIKTQMNEMINLVQSNKIRSIGISNFSENQMRKAHEVLEKHDIPLAVNQVHYSLLRRDIERNGVLDSAKELGVTIIAYTPLGQGLLTGKYHSNPALLNKKFFFFRRSAKRRLNKSTQLIETLKEIGKTHNATPGQVALNWLITYSGETVVAIPGATKLGHAQESAGTLTFSLSRSELEEIVEVSEDFT
ncbi:MAG: aldo/keto reductase [Candidatus Hodarchaeales archaeon]